MHLLHSLTRAFHWHRRTFAALFAAVAVLAGLNAFTARTSAGVPVLIAIRTIPGGTTVGSDDVALVRAPAELVAEGAFAAIGEVIGRTAVIEVPARAVLAPSHLLDSPGQIAAGRLALPVTFSEQAAVSLLRVGSRIDVLGPTTDGQFGVVASSVRVLALPSAAAEEGLLGGSQQMAVLLEVGSTDAARITAAAAISALSFALH